MSLALEQLTAMGEVHPAVQEGATPPRSRPDRPVVSIRPPGRWAALGLRDLWSYRELHYFLIWRDVKVRYKQTMLGVAWAIIQPLLTMLIFTLFFGKLAGLPSDNVPYPIFAYAGLLPWMFVSSAVTSSANSLIGSSNLIAKVYFPRMIIPMSAVGAALVDFAIGFVLLAALMAYYGIAVTWSLLLLPGLVVLTVVNALGVGMLLSALNVKYRDVRHALPFVVQLWMFITPIIYPANIVPGRWRWLLTVNPLAGVIEGYRAALFGLRFDWTGLGISSGVALSLLVFSAYTFRRMEKTFADII